MADQEDPDTIQWWWIGSTDSLEFKGFWRWLTSDSPRAAEATWRVNASDDETVSLPRLAYRVSERGTGGRGILVWQVPEQGIAGLIGSIATVRRTRPGYLHLTAGLASPAERMLLSEVGITAHVQHPPHWRHCDRILRSVWRGTAQATATESSAAESSEPLFPIRGSRL